MTCCAAVGGRVSPEDLPELDAALAVVGQAGAQTIAALAARYGVTKSALGRHRLNCRPGQPEARPSPSQPVPAASQPNLARATPPSQPVPAVDPRQESRIDTIADMVRMNLWKNRGTVLAMVSQWGLPEKEINRYHRIACRRLAAARGGPIAQREQSVAVCCQVRDQMLAHADKLDVEAAEHVKAEEWKAANVKGSLAATARGVALSAQKQIDSWTQKDAITVTVSQAAPDAEVWALVRGMLDAWAPGLSERVEEGLGVFEDRGKRGLDEFVGEVQADMHAIVVRGE